MEYPLGIASAAFDEAHRVSAKAGALDVRPDPRLIIVPDRHHRDLGRFADRGADHVNRRFVADHAHPATGQPDRIADRAGTERPVGFGATGPDDQETGAEQQSGSRAGQGARHPAQVAGPEQIGQG